MKCGRHSKLIILLFMFIMGIMFLTGCKSGESDNDMKVTKDGDSVTQKKTEVEENVTAENQTNEVKKQDKITLPVFDTNDGESTLADETFTFGQVAIGGGGFVTGLISSPTEKNLFFARTDVGGAYRWIEESKSWKSLHYGVSAADKGLLSIDGLAVDPNSPNKVYMVAGCEYFSNHKTVIYISEDYGDTLTQIDVSNMIRVHGNGMGRQNGERIAVDPNDGNIIFCGGRTGGLIKSTDGGNTWEKVSSLAINTTPNNNGICSIVFDKETGKEGTATQRIFIAVSRNNDDNIFVSEDGGATWNAVSGLPKNWMPQRMKMDADGKLLITYADQEGPWNGNNGGIYRYDPNAKTAVDISPSGGRPIGDIVSDPTNADRMVCSTINTWNQQANGGWGDIFYTSEDGGKTWTNILKNMTMDAKGNPWIMKSSIHWAGSLLMDPFNPDRIFVTSGNGIFGCDNIWNETKDFYFNAKGLEETVPLDLVSIPGGSLLSAIGDYSGFVHKDVHEYGIQYKNPNGTNSSIAYAANAKDHWVRISSSDNVPVHYTKDAGATWRELKSVPKLVGSDKASYGYVAISPDASIIFWSPSKGSNTYFTKDEGATWEECKGLRNNTYLVCDPVKSDYVYACNGKSFYISTDGGRTFSSRNILLNGGSRFTIVPGQEGAILLPYSGLALSLDYGENFTRFKGVKSCQAVGVGKPKNEGRPYVIYIWGSLTSDPETDGLFASEDFGTTWIRINNDQNQFGGPGNGNFVVGDMNEYGKVYMGTVGLGIVYSEIVK
jgi:xyloglucan-specific exo-beta-1,4-glucanase